MVYFFLRHLLQKLLYHKVKWAGILAKRFGAAYACSGFTSRNTEASTKWLLSTRYLYFTHCYFSSPFIPYHFCSLKSDADVKVLA